MVKKQRRKYRALYVCFLFALLFKPVRAFASDEPFCINANQASENSVYLEWKYDEAYNYFELFRSDDYADWTRVKKVYSNSTYNYNLLDDVCYRYKVRPCVIKEGGVEYGTFSEEILYCPGQDLTAPELVSVKQTSADKVRLTWKATDNADGYRIYRSTDNVSWSPIKKVSETAAENYNLQEGVCYYYRVKAYIKKDERWLYSQASNTIAFELNQESAAPDNFSVTQCSNNLVFLSWDEVDNADCYSIYRSSDGLSWSRIKKVYGTTAYNYNLSEDSYFYKVKVEKINGEAVHSAFSDALYVDLKGLRPPNNIYTKVESGNKVFISWDGPDDATGYILYRKANEGDWEKVKSVNGLSTYNYNLKAGVEYSYSLVSCKKTEQGVIYSEESEPVQVTIKNESSNAYVASGNYRALVVGETGYAQTLHGPDNDVAVMSDILGRMGYEVHSEINAAKSDIVDLVDVAFMDATEDDVSLFFYSGHGVTGVNTYYSGALQTIDYQYITTEELAELLAGVPGRVIVILDSCGSGAAISDGAGEKGLKTGASNISPQAVFYDDISVEKEFADNAPGFDPVVFNESIINAFSLYNSISPYSAELRQPKFLVLTSSAYEENSETTMNGGVWGGLLTRGISAAVGRDFNTGVWSGNYSADSDNDGLVTLNELHKFCVSYVGGRQQVLCYPPNDNLAIFK